MASRAIRILLINSDSQTLANLSLELSEEGYYIEQVNDASIAKQFLQTKHYDVVICELEYDGEMKGYEIIRTTKKHDALTYIIVYTRVSDVQARLKAFQEGADVIQARPAADPKLLKAQIKALLKRAEETTKEIKGINVIRHKDIVVNRDTRSIYIGDSNIPVSDKEYRIIRMLMRSDGKPVSKKEIMSRVWGYYEESNRVVDVYMTKIRQKVGHEKIMTIRSKGYLLY